MNQQESSSPVDFDLEHEHGRSCKYILRVASLLWDRQQQQFNGLFQLWGCFEHPYLDMWRFPKVGVPLNHYRIFHEINHPAISVPQFMETPFRLHIPMVTELLSPHIPMVSAAHPLILAEVPSCLKVLRLRPERRFCRLGDLSKEAMPAITEPWPPLPPWLSDAVGFVDASTVRWAGSMVPSSSAWSLSARPGVFGADPSRFETTIEELPMLW